jgi:1,2-diacylglycerol 3-alpha-glucosyltransferase
VRVAIFTDSWFPRIDGVTTSVQGFKAEMERRGHSFHVFTSGPRWEHGADVTRYKGFPFWGYPDFHVSTRTGPIDTAEVLREGRFDLVHIQSPFTIGLWGLRAARKVGLPAVTSYHTYLPDLVPYVIPPGLRTVSRRWVWRWTESFFRRCDAVLVPSPSCARELIDHVPHHKIPNLEIHPNGVDVRRFHPGARSDAVRQRMGPPGSLVVLSVGRLAREKDVPFLLHAFAEARRLEPRLHMCIGGQGPELARIQRRAGELGIGPALTYLGFVPDAELASVYAGADAFASASQFETQGMTAVEAMACGTPVAAVRARGLADFVKAGATGYLFEPFDVEGAASAILEAVHAGQGMREAARSHAMTLSLDHSVDQLEAVYKRVASRGRRDGR